MTEPASNAWLPKLTYMTVRCEDGVAEITLDRPSKRNALSSAFVEEIGLLFEAIRASNVRAVVLGANGDHFCAGLDLAEPHAGHFAASDIMHLSRRWHAAFEAIQHCGKPVICALRGAVVGGGLELAASCHIRVADASTFFALPEGRHGIFTGGGATVRVTRLIGEARMMDMMLTGRVYAGSEACTVGLCQYLADDSLAQAREIAAKAAQNLPLSNLAITSGIAHLANMPAGDALFAEAYIAGITNTQPAAQQRLAEFLGKAAPGDRNA